MKKRAFLQAILAAPVLALPVAKATPGRRVSVDPNDSGYAPFPHRVRVTIDGVEPKYCVTADEGLGEVHCWRVKRDGTLLIECGRPVIKVERGVVRIIDI